MHRIFSSSQQHILLWFKDRPRFLRQALKGVAVTAVAVMLVQVLYPANRLLPSVKVEGRKVGGQTVKAASHQLQRDYTKAQVIVRTDDASFAKPLEEVGIEVQAERSARSATHYPFMQRLIPFSSVYLMIAQDVPMQVKFDQERLKYFAEQIQKDGFVAAINASVKVEGSRAVLVPAKPSKDYPVSNVTKALQNAHYRPKTTLHIKPRTAQAERTNSEVREVLAQAQRAIDTPLSLKIDKENITVDQAAIGSWLDFPEDPASKKLYLGVKADAVKKYLQGVSSKVYRAPGVTKIEVVDGREVSRVAGPMGRGIDSDKAVVLLDAALKKGEAVTLAVPIIDLPPSVTYNRRYSNTDAGLTALLNDLGGAKGYGLSVMELGGRSSNIGGDKRFVAASTYKLFVAYALFKEVEAGRMQWEAPFSGSTVQGCFEAMIVRSDNPCAKAFGDQIGWQKIENQMQALGLSNTELSPSLYTTANDLSLFLYKLENGTLVSSADRARLIDAMKRQIYRSGIPTGTGLTVANKPGFIGSYIHDPGIVYGPRGPYVLVIMTSGSSWASVANIAKQINAFLK